MKGTESHLLGHLTCASEAKRGLSLCSFLILFSCHESLCVFFLLQALLFSKPCFMTHWESAQRLLNHSAMMLFDWLPIWSANRKHFFPPFPLQTEQKTPNWRNGQAPVALNRHDLELLEHLIFYNPWIWKCAWLWGHMWWKDNWKLLEHFPWAALRTSQLRVAWGKARCSKDVIFKTAWAQKPLDFYVLFPYWRHYQKLSHTLSLI